MNKKARFLFIVQGEGRGHMTQAVAMSEILTEAGHEVEAVLTGSSDRRKTPEFFNQAFSKKIILFQSPNFRTDSTEKAVRIVNTILYNTLQLPKFFKSLRQIHRVRKSIRPDVIINFYDFVGGLYFSWYKPRCKRISIGHQYFFNHPEFKFPEGKALDKFLIKLNNKITGGSTHEKWALSFKDAHSIPKKCLFILPPLLRKEVLNSEPVPGDFILSYVVNSGYAEEIIQSHNKFDKIPLHLFWDGLNFPEEVNQNITLHRLDAQKFLDRMRKCRFLLTTAGFESVCEAAYLGKPVVTVPVEGQYEQHCNAADAARAGLGIAADHFDIAEATALIKNQPPTGSADFRLWCSMYKIEFLKAISRLLSEDSVAVNESIDMIPAQSFVGNYEELHKLPKN